MTALAPDFATDHELARARVILHRIGFDPHAAQHWQTLGKAIGAVCRIKDCEAHSDALGMCQAHYKRHARAVANEAARLNRDARRGAA